MDLDLFLLNSMKLVWYPKVYLWLKILVFIQSFRSGCSDSFWLMSSNTMSNAAWYKYLIRKTDLWKVKGRGSKQR